MTLIQRWLEDNINPNPTPVSRVWWISEATGHSLDFDMDTQQLVESWLEIDGGCSQREWLPITWSTKLRNVITTLVCPD